MKKIRTIMFFSNLFILVFLGYLNSVGTVACDTNNLSTSTEDITTSGTEYSSEDSDETLNNTENRIALFLDGNIDRTGMLHCGRLWNSSTSAECSSARVAYIPFIVPGPSAESPNTSWDPEYLKPDYENAKFCKLNLNGGAEYYNMGKSLLDCEKDNLLKLDVYSDHVFQVYDNIMVESPFQTEGTETLYYPVYTGDKLTNTPDSQECYITAIAVGKDWNYVGFQKQYFNISCDNNSGDGILQEDYACLISKEELTGRDSRGSVTRKGLLQMTKDEFQQNQPVCPGFVRKGVSNF